MNKLIVHIFPYDKRDEYMYEVEGETLLECMFKIVNNSSYFLDEELKTLEEYYNYIDDFNGDGCDYIISIIDLDNSKVLYR